MNRILGAFLSMAISFTALADPTSANIEKGQIKAVIAAPQPAFYNRNTVIKSINCAEKTVNVRIGNDMIRQFDFDSKASAEQVRSICENLSQFAEDSKSTQAGKSITLMTVESKGGGDSIYEQEVIGFVDVDNIRSTKESIDDIDPVYTYYCGTIGNNPRASSHLCLMQSREGLYFVQFTSVQQYSLMKTSVISTDNQKMVLQSKDKKGNVEMLVNATKVDKETYSVTVDFGNGPASAVLTKQTAARRKPRM